MAASRTTGERKKSTARDNEKLAHRAMVLGMNAAGKIVSRTFAITTEDTISELVKTADRQIGTRAALINVYQVPGVVSDDYLYPVKRITSIGLVPSEPHKPYDLVRTAAGKPRLQMSELGIGRIMIKGAEGDKKWLPAIAMPSDETHPPRDVIRARTLVGGTMLLMTSELGVVVSADTEDLAALDTQLQTIVELERHPPPP